MVIYNICGEWNKLSSSNFNMYFIDYMLHLALS